MESTLRAFGRPTGQAAKLLFSLVVKQAQAGLAWEELWILSQALKMTPKQKGIKTKMLSLKKLKILKGYVCEEVGHSGAVKCSWD